MADIKALAEELVNLTVKDVQELATILKEEYGIEPAAAAVVAVAGPAAAAEAEQTEFDVILKSAGAAKLGVVKAVKEACSTNAFGGRIPLKGLITAISQRFYLFTRNLSQPSFKKATICCAAAIPALMFASAV